MSELSGATRTHRRSNPREAASMTDWARRSDHAARPESWGAAIGLTGADRTNGVSDHSALRTARTDGEVDARDLEEVGEPVECTRTAGHRVLG